jgi:hypothetical protein
MPVKKEPTMPTSIESYDDALDNARTFQKTGRAADKERVTIAAAQIGELVDAVEGVDARSVSGEALRRIRVLCKALAGLKER